MHSSSTWCSTPTRVTCRSRSTPRRCRASCDRRSRPYPRHRCDRSATRMELVWPSHAYLPGYIDALNRGWSPDNVRGEFARLDELRRIADHPDRFLSELVYPDAADAGTI